MVDLLVLTVILPLFAAGGVILASHIFNKLGIERGYVRALVSALLIGIGFSVALIVSTGGIGSRLALRGLTPPLLAESAVVAVRWDAALWPLGLSFSVALFSLLLVAGGRDGLSSQLVSGLLVMLAAGLAALWSANPFTTIVCWAVYDGVYALGWLAIEGRKEDALRALILGGSANLLLWLGTVVAGGGIGAVQWALIPPGGVKMSYWTLAGLLRLGVYPLHLSIPRHVDSSSPIVGAMLLSPVLGWGVWIRMALVGDHALTLAPWVAILALFTVLGGGVLAWTAGSSREARPWISMGANGSVVLSAVMLSLWGQGRETNGEGIVPVMTLGAAGWMLGTAVLFSGRKLALSQIRRLTKLPQSISSLIGALSLIGMPLTLGFVSMASLMRGLVTSAGWGWGVGFFLGHVLLVAAVTRWLLESEPGGWRESGLAGRIAWGVGLAGLACPLLVIGVSPPLLASGFDVTPSSLPALLAQPSPLGWLLWGGALVLGVGLAWLSSGLRPRISLWLTAIHDVVLLDWGYTLLMGALERGFGLLRILDDVLGGRGALLWACILLLVWILTVGG